LSGLVQVRGDAPETACPHCGAAVGADQRYCLSCGKPCAPLRLPFLDVLHNGSSQRALGPSDVQNGYVPPLYDGGHRGPLQHYSGLFALLGVLLLAGLAGLLIGHWAAGGSGPSGPQVVKIEGLAGLTPSSTSGATANTTTSTSTTASAAKEIEHESKKEEKETAASNLAKPAKHTAAAVKRLGKLTGKRYEQEINKIANGPAPIETGG
jgi:hypothetical protein